MSLGHIPSPQPGIISDADIDMEAVGSALKKLVTEIKAPAASDVIFSLPESRIFTRVVYDLPYLTDAELAQAIKYAAEEFVPMPIAEVNLNYQVIYRSPKKDANSRTIVFVVASPKALVNKYIKILEKADLKPVAIETEMIASTRSIITGNPYAPTTLIIHLGTTTTNFAVVSEGLIFLTRSIGTGSLALTRVIAQSFDFELTQAEEYKKVYGLLEDQLEGKLFQTLKPIMDVVSNEAKRVIQAHEMQNRQRSVKLVMLTGGGAKLPGVIKYFTNVLGLEVQESDPWLGVAIDPNLKSKLMSEGPSYVISAGLALRDF
jgi:type IV pilus assembly protein PilM